MRTHSKRAKKPSAIPLYMCPHTAIYVSSYYFMCPQTTTYASSYYSCPHTTIYLSSYYYICVLILLYVSSYYYICPHTTIYVSSYYFMRPHTTICVLILLYVSTYYCICVIRAKRLGSPMWHPPLILLRKARAKQTPRKESSRKNCHLSGRNVGVSPKTGEKES